MPKVIQLYAVSGAPKLDNGQTRGCQIERVKLLRLRYFLDFNPSCRPAGHVPIQQPLLDAKTLLKGKFPFYDKGVVTNYREGGYKTGGGACEVLPLPKGGRKKCWGSLHAVA